MFVQFLAHSGFYVELEQVVLLFDWWQGDLPPLPEKPLLVFVSHHHPDHFNPEIFKLRTPERDVRFLLGKDIRFAPSNRRRWGITEELAARCLHLGGYRREEPLPGVLVETLPSTDTGVAFVVTAEGRTIFHAGDLNWWYWRGEPGNRDMELHFKEYLEPLRGRTLDLAMMPLDSRQEEGEDLGLCYLLELAKVKKVLPMHQWDDYSATDRFLQHHPDRAEQVLPISHRGQTFEV